MKKYFECDQKTFFTFFGFGVITPFLQVGLIQIVDGRPISLWFVFIILLFGFDVFKRNFSRSFSYVFGLPLGAILVLGLTVLWIVVACNQGITTACS